MPRRLTATIAWAVALLIVAVAGCSGSADSPAARPSLAPAGPGRLTLLPHWEEMELSPAEVEKTQTELEAAIDRGAAALLTPSSETWMYSFWALATDDSRVVGSVVIAPSVTGSSLDDIEQGIMGYQGQSPYFLNFRLSRVEIPPGEAILVEYETKSHPPGKADTEFSSQEYWVVSGDNEYHATFTCVAPGDDCLADAETMISTLGVSP